MTPAQAKTALAALLADQLGAYTWPNGSSRAAINLGEPPSDATASGLEVIVDDTPEYALRGRHNGTLVNREVVVRFIPHNATATTVSAAVERVAAAYWTSSPVTIPASEQLGIGKQYTLRILST